MTSSTTLRNWVSNLEPETRAQAERAARLSIVPMAVALMADAHVGIGATIGSVIPTEGAIIPSAVGVDIGCGMAAVLTSLSASDLPSDLQPLVDEFSRSIPSGVGRRRNSPHSRAVAWMEQRPINNDIVDRQTTTLQLGTLGSGNHFLEVCLDEKDRIWVMLHSGSRGAGNKLASLHIKLAKQQEQGLEDPDLAYFLEGTEEFQAYVQDMLWAQGYALENREIMLDEALNQLFRFVGAGQEIDRVNCHHNYATREEHYGRAVWVTRKGAIRAEVGDLGVIPGSMGTKSYIVKGKGNPLSYNSCSHGAGRRMSRGQARRTITVETLTQQMEGRAWNRSEAGKLIDEAPGAYKDIDVVMKDQEDLVEIVHELRAVVNYKGV